MPRFCGFTTDNSHTLIGVTRGIYLEGVGAVLTAELIVVNAPVNIMHPLPTKEEVVQMRKKKLERIPLLKKILKDALVSTAAALDTIPPDEQIVIAVIIPRFTFGRRRRPSGPDHRAGDQEESFSKPGAQPSMP